MNKGNSLDILVGVPHLWSSSGVSVIGAECKYCRKIILSHGYACDICSFPIHKQCMLKGNISSCGNVTPYQLDHRARLAHYLEKRPPKIQSRTRAAVSRTKWQRRFFILTKDCNIFYFKDKSSSAPRGVVSLTKYTNVQAEKKGKIRLYNEGDSTVREFVLRADNEELQALWIREINKMIEQSKKGIFGLAQDLHTKQLDSRMNQDCKIAHKLSVKVSEGRNFPPTNLGTAEPSVYCILSCGYEFRQTLTIWNDQNPIWDEEFELIDFDKEKDVFRCYVMEDNLLLTDSDLGIVEIPISSITDSIQNKWFPILPPLPEHVTGDIHLQITRAGAALTIRVFECNNLAAQDPNGLSDPYVTIAVGKQKKKTQVIKKSLNPYFGESFLFRWEESASHVEVVVWDWDRIGGNDFLGQVLIPTTQIPPQNEKIEKRYLLQPHPPNEKETPRSRAPTSPRKELGEIRLRVGYNELKVYPITVYLGLMGLLMQERIPFVKSLIHIIPDKPATASYLVRIFDANLDSLRLVRELTSIEIEETDDPSIIFRGNTLITKSMDFFMKYAGASYLRLVIGPLVTEVNNLKLSYEVDPLKAPVGEDISKNMTRLIDLCQRFMSRIFESSQRCPIIMQAAFTHIRAAVKKKYSKEQILVVKYTSVSAFVFLRFFCPAIQNPKTHGLVDRLYPNTARTFTLVAKTIQNLANLVEFGDKEPYMKEMNRFIIDNKENMKVYLNAVSLLQEVPETKIGITEDLWVEKELASISSSLFASQELIADNLTGTPLGNEFQSVMTQLSLAMEEHDRSSSALVEY